MSNLVSPNGTSLKGGVVLGGRELRLTISREEAEVLKMLAQATNRRPLDLAHEMFNKALSDTWQQFLRARFVWQLTHWYSWR